jgi:hypothetical protein
MNECGSGVTSGAVFFIKKKLPEEDTVIPLFFKDGSSRKAGNKESVRVFNF